MQHVSVCLYRSTCVGIEMVQHARLWGPKYLGLHGSGKGCPKQKLRHPVVQHGPSMMEHGYIEFLGCLRHLTPFILHGDDAISHKALKSSMCG